MKAFLILSVLFFNAYSLIAQRVVDIEADLVSVEAHHLLNFYKKVDKNTYLRIKIAPENTSANEFYLTTKEYRIHQSFPEKDLTTFEINNLPNTTHKDYLNSYFGKTYSKENNTSLENNSKKVLELLNYNSNQLFTLDVFEKHNTSQDSIWQKKRTLFLNYFFIRVNKRKTILVFSNNANPSAVKGFLMTTKQKPLLFINEYRTPKPTSFKENHFLEKQISDSLLHKKSIADWVTARYSIKNGQITDLLSHEKLLKREFDSVFYNDNFIVGKKDSTTNFYNKKLQNITPKNLRAIYLPKNEYQNSVYRGIQVLVNNNVKWLIPSGKLKDSLAPIPRYICGTGMDEYRVQLQITHDKNYFYLNKHQLAKTATYDTVYFINGKKQFQSYETSGYPRYLKVEKNGKWGLLSFKNNPIEPSAPLQTTEILAVDYDAIELTGAFIKFKKEGLWGYFQINEKPIYSSLEKFDSHFARFSLPNGRKGWLTKDGKEYIDR